MAGFDGQGNIAVGDGALNAGVVTGDFNVAVWVQMLFVTIPVVFIM